MKKTIISILVILLLLSCGVKKLRWSMYKDYYEETLVNYFSTELKNRPDTFLKYFQNDEMHIFYSETYFLFSKSIFNTPCNVFLYSFGQKFQKDLTSLTDIQPFYEYEAGGHIVNEYTVHDKPAFFSYIDSCRHILNGNLDFRQKIDTIPKFTTLKEPFNVKLSPNSSVI